MCISDNDSVKMGMKKINIMNDKQRNNDLPAAEKTADSIYSSTKFLPESAIKYYTRIRENIEKESSPK